MLTFKQFLKENHIFDLERKIKAITSESNRNTKQIYRMSEPFEMKSHWKAPVQVNEMVYSFSVASPPDELIKKVESEFRHQRMLDKVVGFRLHFDSTEDEVEGFAWIMKPKEQYRREAVKLAARCFTLYENMYNTLQEIKEERRKRINVILGMRK